MKKKKLALKVSQNSKLLTVLRPENLIDYKIDGTRIKNMQFSPVNITGNTYVNKKCLGHLLML